MSNKTEAESWLQGAAGDLSRGNADSSTPLLALTGIGYALLDVADAIREQTAATADTPLLDGVR